MYHTREPNSATYDAGWAWFSMANQPESLHMYQRRVGTRRSCFVATSLEAVNIHRDLNLVHATDCLATLVAAGASTTDDLVRIFGAAPETVRVLCVINGLAYQCTAAFVLRYLRECETRSLLKVHTERGESAGSYGIRVANALREAGYDGWWYDDDEVWCLCDDRPEDGGTRGHGEPDFRLISAPGEALLNLHADCTVLRRFHSWLSL